MRCSRPGVPGLTHGRAPFSLREKGRKSVFARCEWTGKGGSVSSPAGARAR